MTAIKRYLISAPPRVGGILITNIISSANASALHTHDPQHKTDDDSITGLIIVGRRDIFSAVMSNCIVWHTNQSAIYNQHNIEPFEVIEQDFVLQYADHVWHSKSHDLTRPYGLVETFYFDDFVNNYMHVLTRLGLQQSRQHINYKDLSIKAPYNYKQLVRNHQDLKILFDRLETENVANPYIKYNKLGIESGGFD